MEKVQDKVGRVLGGGMANRLEERLKMINVWSLHAQRDYVFVTRALPTP